MLYYKRAGLKCSRQMRWTTADIMDKEREPVVTADRTLTAISALPHIQRPSRMTTVPYIDES